MTIPVFDAADPAAARHFAEAGWVCMVVAAGPPPEQLASWADEVAGLDPAAGVLHYFEETDAGPARCRSEHFVDVHAGLRAFLAAGPMLDVAGALLGEPAVLYKEKLNFKLAGGAGYSPHQDAPAYRFVETHVSCMVAIDDATAANGCLEVVSGAHHRIWPQDDRGCVAPEVVASMTWEVAEVPAGGALWFHSRTPHRSGPNHSARPRRALYPTYNAAREGNLRDEYYRRKAEELAAGGDASRRVSLIGDFEGRMVG